MRTQQSAFLTLKEVERRLPVYMYGTGYWSSQEEIVRPEGYPLYQWIYCTAGEGELFLGNEKYQVKAGTGIFLYPNEAHEYRASQEPWEIYWINFEGAQARTIVETAGLLKSGVYRADENEAVIRNTMQEALRLAMSDDPLAGFECSKLVYALLLDIMKNMTGQNGSIETNYKRLQPVFDYMDKHYGRPITLQEMADVAGVSGQHLCLLFRRIVDARPVEYLNRLRIRKSKERLLMFPAERIGEIARSVGFDSPGYYNALFKKLEGITPDRFRKLNGVW